MCALNTHPLVFTSVKFNDRRMSDLCGLLLQLFDVYYEKTQKQFNQNYYWAQNNVAKIIVEHKTILLFAYYMVRYTQATYLPPKEKLNTNYNMKISDYWTRSAM